MYLDESVSLHIRRTLAAMSYGRSVKLAHIVTEGKAPEVLGLFDQQNREMSRLDILHLKVRFPTHETDLRAAHTLWLHFGAFHIASLHWVDSEKRYHVERGEYARLRFDITRYHGRHLRAVA